MSENIKNKSRTRREWYQIGFKDGYEQALEDLKNKNNKNICEHDWVYETKSTDDYNENGELYYMTTRRCTKCDNTEMVKHIGSV